jgi:hypothetical protein
MNLATRKYNFIQELTTIDEILLRKLEILLKDNKEDWYNQLSFDERQEIEIGINQADNDQFVCHQEVMNKFQKWH